ncbi:glycoprotein precursor [Guaroa virus]|uniref:Envelopment polyprotein n=1 Tax=Guaroa virus TaxID=80941 RepID=A0A0E3TU99_9VIRU|nr:glycoprotein precursor [Guaroa virus]
MNISKYMWMLVVLYFINLSEPTPVVFNKCFTGGSLVFSKKSDTGMSEICLKDDISMIKTSIDFKKENNTIVATNKVYKQWIVQDWKNCHPMKMVGGTINIIEVTADLMFKSVSYTCTTDCTIGIDRENALIIFQTNKLNHFEVSGTTIKTGWFKNKASVSLDQTCEHIKITCGRKSMQLHACFKDHMSCIRFLHRTILPGYMAASICQNIEVILLTVFTLIIFGVLCILIKTYICYLFLPLYMIPAYIYGYVYNKSCKICINCGLAYHPFTNCGSHCVCGAKFETSDRMRMHRQSGFCPGYKSLRAARSMCKSKTCSLIFSIGGAILILSFVTPIAGEKLYTLDELPEAYTMEINSIKIMQSHLELKLWIIIAILFTIALIMMIFNFIIVNICKLFYFHCYECNMYHTKRNIRYNGDFCNKCGFCMCGVLEDVEGLKIHKTTESCKVKIHYRSTNFALILFGLLLILISVSASLASCDAEEPNINCLGYKINLTCNKPLTNEEAVNYLVDNNIIEDVEREKALELTTDLANMKKQLNFQTNFKTCLVLEHVFLLNQCGYYKDLESNNGIKQIPWRTIAKTEAFDICSIRKHQHFCRCMATGEKCNSANWDFAKGMNDTYNFKPVFYRRDVNLFLRIFSEAFPGSTYRYLYSILKKKDTEKIKELLTDIEKRFPYNQLLVGFIKFGHILLIDNLAYSLPPDVSRMGAESRSKVETSGYQVGQPILSCNNPLIIRCMSPKLNVVIPALLKCHRNNKDSLYYIDHKVYTSFQHPQSWCFADKHCLIHFRPIPESELNAVKKRNCFSNQVTEDQDQYNTKQAFCRAIKFGMCTSILNQQSRSIECDNNLIYNTDNKLTNEITGDVNEICLNTGCKDGRYPLNPINSVNCTWEENVLKSKHAQLITVENIEELKRLTQDRLTHTLDIYKFKKTINFPKIIPSKKYISLQGIDSSDGIDSSYIEIDITARTNEALGIQIHAPDNQPIMDLIIHITLASTKADYLKIYETGPTVGINVNHDEHCTGSCPEQIPHKQNWLTFSKERTSQWGCEEFGCLAINEGCLFGSCQDIIKSEARVFKKVAVEKHIVRLCIIHANEDRCIDLDPEEPLITESLEMQLDSITTRNLPELILIKDHKVYTGQINDLGAVSSGCGDVQVINNTIFGGGTVKFDYLCYGAHRKDVVVRKCYNNHYDSCKLLTEQKELTFLDESSTVSLEHNNYIIGSLKLKIVLGDIRYKLFKKDIQLEVEGECIGCKNCISGIDCNFKITSPSETSCKIESPCSMFIENLIIKAGHTDINFKIHCKMIDSKVIDFKICNNIYKVHVTETKGNDKIELNTGDQTSYVQQHDNRCGTWLCRLKEEGIGLLLEPLKAIFGTYITWFWVILGVIVSLFLGVYIFLPMVFKIKDILKKNEEEYKKDIRYRE